LPEKERDHAMIFEFKSKFERADVDRAHRGSTR
jgi:hypothetical protein